jgi:plastocyanin
VLPDNLLATIPITSIYMKKIDDWGFYILIAAVVAIMGVVVMTGSMPEKAAANFNPLTDMSISTNYQVLQQPTADHNVFVYAINDVAAKTVPIAERDSRVKEIIDNARSSNAAVTIAAVQPTEYEFRSDGRTVYSTEGVLTIAVNQQTVDNQSYLQAVTFHDVEGKRADSYQQAWNVMVDLDKGVVTDIQQTSNRSMTNKLQLNTIYIGTNMFMPNAVKIDAGTTLKWINTSDLPHNIMGMYDTASGEKIPIDSGFIQNGDSWKYAFNEPGTFEYHCSTHSGEGMKGSIIVSK